MDLDNYYAKLEKTEEELKIARKQYCKVEDEYCDGYTKELEDFKNQLFLWKGTIDSLTEAYDNLITNEE